MVLSDPIGSLKLADELGLHASNPSSSSFQRYLSKSLLAELRSEAQHELLEGEKTPNTRNEFRECISDVWESPIFYDSGCVIESPQVGSMS